MRVLCLGEQGGVRIGLGLYVYVYSIRNSKCISYQLIYNVDLNLFILHQIKIRVLKLRL